MLAVEKKQMSDIEDMLNYPEINKQLSTALPNGLYLYKVLYCLNSR